MNNKALPRNLQDTWVVGGRGVLVGIDSFVVFLLRRVSVVKNSTGISFSWFFGYLKLVFPKAFFLFYVSWHFQSAGYSCV